MIAIFSVLIFGVFFSLYSFFAGTFPGWNLQSVVVSVCIKSYLKYGKIYGVGEEGGVMVRRQ